MVELIFLENLYHQVATGFGQYFKQLNEMLSNAFWAHETNQAKPSCHPSF